MRYPEEMANLGDEVELPTLQILTASDYEGGEFWFKALLSEETDRPVTFTYSTMESTATSDVDYIAVCNGATIPAGSRYVDIPITVIDDSQSEESENFFIRVDNVVNAAAVKGGRFVITDDD